LKSEPLGEGSRRTSGGHSFGGGPGTLHKVIKATVIQRGRQRLRKNPETREKRKRDALGDYLTGSGVYSSWERTETPQGAHKKE